MKKIFISLLLFLFAFAFSPYLFADTGTVNYDLTFIEDYGYDLANGGTFESMPGYSCTGRTKIIGNSLKFTTVNAQYILFWNSSAMFIGYDIIDSGGGLIFLNSYLGDGVYNESFVYPYGAFTFALMCDNLTDNGYINYPLSTYSGKFSAPSYLNYTDSVLTGTLGSLGSYTYNYTDDVLTDTLTNIFGNPSYMDFVTEYNNMTLEDIFNRPSTPSADQLIINPDFITDVNNWTQHNASTSHWDSSGTLHLVKNISSYEWDMYQDNVNMVVGHLYYATVKCKNLFSPTEVYALDEIGFKTTSEDLDLTVTNPVYDEWNVLTDIFESNSTSQHFMLFAGDSSPYLPNGQTAEFDYARVYDLTDIFGSGNEPSQEQFEVYMTNDSYDTAVTVQNIGYSKTNLDDSQTTFTARSIPVLTLTNLIQNGQFTNDVNSNGLADNFYTTNALYSLSVAGQKVLYNNANYFIIETTPAFSTIPIGENVYVSGMVSSINGSFYAYSNSSQSISNAITATGNFSKISNLTTNMTFLSFIRYGAVSGNFFEIDNISLFNSSTYTKTQIDNALINFGYLPYNTTYYLPDMGASGTGERSFGTCGSEVCYIADGSGIGTDLEIYDYYTLLQDGYFLLDSGNESEYDMFQEWRSVFGDQETSYLNNISGINPSLLPISVTTDWATDTADRDYYLQLYRDSYNLVDRWEWYSFGGVTASNYAYYKQLYEDSQDMIDRWEWWATDGITAENYDYYINPSLTHTLYLDAYNEVPRYEFFNEVTPLMFNTLYPIYLILLAMNPITFESFDNSVVYWEYTYNIEPDETIVESIFSFLNEINPFWVIVFAFGVMGLLAIILIYTHAPFISYVIFETLLFILFAFVGFFANWLIIIAVAIMYIIILLLVKRKTGGL